MKDKFLQIVTHPLIISLLLTLLIYNLLPEYFTKYKVEFVRSKINSRASKTYFEDLNNDQRPERIMSYYNTLGDACFDVYNSNGSFVDQFNFKGKFVPKQFNLWFFDTNGNKSKEIYLLSHKNDSIFLQLQDIFSNYGSLKRTVFIDVVPGLKPDSYLGALLFSKCDLNGNGTNEIIINLNKGFSGTPRNIYSYDPATDKVLKSPHLTNQSRVVDCVDLENDGFKELIISNYSAGNKIDSSITKRSDESSWVMVLKNDLQFKFEPLEIKNPFSSINSIKLKNKKGNYDIICIIKSKKPDQYPNMLIHMDAEGKFLKKQILPVGQYQLLGVDKESEFLLFNRTSGQLSKFDFSFSEKDIAKFQPLSLISPLKLSKKHSFFWVVSDPDYRNLKILDNNFKNPVEFQIDEKGTQKITPRVLQSETGMNDLYIQSKNKFYIFSYSKNPLFPFRYLSYLILFFMLYGIVLLIRKGQQLKMEKQRAIENEISALQIKNINSQIDPHFVFNAINTISAMTLMENKFEADTFISKFSNFMRGTLNHSDKIRVSLKDELDFVENFILLQKIRYNDRFDYAISVESNVNLETKIPKHVLFTYVENAIKHGLSQTKGKGMLKISTSQQGGRLHLIVEDNGPGIILSNSNKTDSTGNGLKIMEKMYGLYAKMYKTKISHTLTELKDGAGKKAGIKVEIII